jgi:2-C-methyl-D-erythritol 4-phosphate cytidylyltransferase
VNVAAPSHKLYALVPCAGVGMRAATVVPKQYARVGGAAVVEHTLRALNAVARLERILVVLAPGDAWFDNVVDLARRPRCMRVACGGPSRARTVVNGLQSLREHGARDDDWVLVHDAARCLVEPATIDRLIDACLTDEVGGLLALPLGDTLKQAQGRGDDARAASTLDRSDKWLAQTPQMFRIGLLERALREAGDGVTDEASAVEQLGLQPRLVLGDASNFKITWPQELLAAERWMATR